MEPRVILCRRCGIELFNEVYRVMGICGQCLVEAEQSSLAVIPRPKYGTQREEPDVQPA